ncbi:hypothetical protein J2J97_32380 (plasmid) [Rhizobium bangladeshense]|uniref:hypothetical protein n=1 Tax=Rhizobium bangladeshense TaxID=1138189 RepID=UPI001A9A15AB|nr:hypothetical protein [Rhizobium bangladeshense]QSY98603.1 hypothetical protein J2J97_32380 [Rhizobium bangladeshense]
MTTDDTHVRSRTKVTRPEDSTAGRKAFLLALGHLTIGLSKEAVEGLIGDRFSLKVPDAPELEHRWMRPEDLDKDIYCEASDKAATPVTVLIL